MTSLAFDKAISTGGGGGAWDELLFLQNVSQQWFLPPVESGRHIGTDYSELVFNFNGTTNPQANVSWLRLAHSDNWNGSSGNQNQYFSNAIHQTIDTYRGGFSSDPYISYNTEGTVYYMNGSRTAGSNQQINITVRMSLAGKQTYHRPRLETFCQYFDSQYNDNMMSVGYGFFNGSAITNATTYNSVGLYLAAAANWTGTVTMVGLKAGTL